MDDNIEKIIEDLLRVDNINELYPENAGERITDFKDYNDAIDKIKQKCDNQEILAYCPDALKFKI